jgi:hypothetical protein
MLNGKMALRLIFFPSCAAVLLAQGNYEIQTYPSETQAPETTMLELHSNFTIQGSKGYQRYVFSPDTWTLEIRPIIDKQIGRWYLAFNPVLDRSFHGPSVSQGVVFAPDFKAGYDITKKINAGLEYYSSLGPVGNFDPLYQQEQQIVPGVDLNLSPKWGFNFGVGVGVTRGTDRLLVKMILGRRFGKTKSGN